MKELVKQLEQESGRSFEWNESAALEEAEKKHDHQSGLTVKLLSVLGGLLAALFFIGFCFISRLYESSFALMFFGIVFIGGAIVLNKLYDNVLLDTISVSLYIIGYTFLGMGMGKAQASEDLICWVFIATGCGTLLLIQNYILSFLAVLFINGSLMSFLFRYSDYHLHHVYLSFLTLTVTCWYLNEARLLRIHPAIARLYNPLRLGLTVSFLGALFLVSTNWFNIIFQHYLWISFLPVFAASLFMVFRILDLLGVNAIREKFIVYVLCAAVLLPTCWSPAIAGAILIVLLSFRVHYRTGLVFGTVSFIYFISQYYYDLKLTLLTKSALMLTSGLFFLILYVLTRKKLTADD